MALSNCIFVTGDESFRGAVVVQSHTPTPLPADTHTRPHTRRPTLTLVLGEGEGGRGERGNEGGVNGDEGG